MTLSRCFCHLELLLGICYCAMIRRSLSVLPANFLYTRNSPQHIVGYSEGRNDALYKQALYKRDQTSIAGDRSEMSMSVSCYSGETEWHPNGEWRFHCPSHSNELTPPSPTTPSQLVLHVLFSALLHTGTSC